jgi:hypothetical protein
VIGGKMLAIRPKRGISVKLDRIQRKVRGGRVIIQMSMIGRFTTKLMALVIPGGKTSQNPSIFF